MQNTSLGSSGEMPVFCKTPKPTEVNSPFLSPLRYSGVLEKAVAYVNFSREGPTLVGTGFRGGGVSVLVRPPPLPLGATEQPYGLSSSVRSTSQGLQRPRRAVSAPAGPQRRPIPPHTGPGRRREDAGLCHQHSCFQRNFFTPPLFFK